MRLTAYEAEKLLSASADAIKRVAEERVQEWDNKVHFLFANIDYYY